MIRRRARTPCLGERVAALADGSLRPDVHDRALAHTLACPSCRVALEVERDTVLALRSLQAPAPSPHMVTQLIALGGIDGPLRPRRPVGPGMSAPRPVPIAAWPPSMAAPSAESRRRRMARPRIVGAVAAGTIGVSCVTVGMLAVTAGQSPSPRSPSITAQLLPATPPGPTARSVAASSRPAAGSATVVSWPTQPGPSWAVAGGAVAGGAEPRGSVAARWSVASWTPTSAVIVPPRRLPPALVAATGR